MILGGIWNLRGYPQMVKKFGALQISDRAEKTAIQEK